MNLFRFLKNTRGAIKPLNALLVTGAATTAFFVVTNQVANKQIEAKRQVRMLSGISSTAPQAGMHRRGGMLTSINVRDGLNQLATAEERAEMNSDNVLSRYAANQDALNKLGGNIGRAAQFTDSDAGLNTANREAVQDNTRFVVGNPNAVDGQYVANGTSRTEGGSGQGQLAPASMTRASGNAFGSSFNPASGSAAGAGTGATGGITAGEGAPRLSGAMPGGSNIVSRMGLDGAATRSNSSSFGRDRNGRGHGAGRVGNERDELKDILKKSAAADTNANASANEGGRAFLANAQTSGGVTVDGSADTQGTGSSQDLAANTARKLKSVGNRLDQESDKQQEKAAKQRALIRQLIATIIWSIGTMVLGAAILRNLDDTIKQLQLQAAAAVYPPVRAALLAALKTFKLKRWLVAAGMIAAVGAANAWLYINAKNFVSDYGAYGGTTIATIAQIVSVLSVAASVQTAINPRWKEFIKNLWKHAKSMFNPVGLFMPKI